MPELPEVETIRCDLEKVLVGKKILGVETDAEKLFSPSFKEVLKGVAGQTIKAVGRQAKLLYFSLSNSQYLLVHLKMTGRLLVREKGTPCDEWQHATFVLEGGKELRFADLRLFGYLKLVDSTQKLGEVLGEYGPEPLKDMSLEDFRSAVKGRRKPIKLMLMDQAVISGVGNIYANEALFEAGIDPRRQAASLTDKETSLLFAGIEKVLTEGLHYRGTTANDDKYVDAYGKKGQYQEHLRVYGREGLPCPKCQGKIQRIALGGRGTFFCPACQQ